MPLGTWGTQETGGYNILMKDKSKRVRQDQLMNSMRIMVSGSALKKTPDGHNATEGREVEAK